MKIEAKNLVVTAALVFLASLVVASTTFYVMNQNFEKERATFESELRTVDVTKKNSSLSTTISTSETKIVDNSFDPLIARVGDKFGLLTLSSIGAYNQKYQTGNNSQTISATNFSANFDGRVTVKAAYQYTGPNEPSLGGESLSVSITDPESMKLVPVLKGEKNAVFFIKNLQEIKSALGLTDKGKSGNIILTMNSVELNRYPAEVGSVATFFQLN